MLAAQGFTALAPIPGLTNISPTAVVNSATLAVFFNNLYKYLIGLAAVLAVIEIIWGGFEISTKDSVSKQSNGRQRITQAILGLVLILSPVVVFSIINPSILNLSFNLPALNTTTTPSVTGNGTETSVTKSTTQATAPETGCKTVVSGLYLETAICASQGDASNYTCTNGVKNPVLKSGSSADYSDAVTYVYCQKSITVIYAKNGGAGISTGVIPRDLSAQNTFSSECNGGGGVMKEKAVEIFASVTYCPPISESGLTSNVAACWHATLTCQPK